jgi:protein involved in polysaccharide export with SLBB domain
MHCSLKQSSPRLQQWFRFAGLWALVMVCIPLQAQTGAFSNVSSWGVTGLTDPADRGAAAGYNNQTSSTGTTGIAVGRSLNNYTSPAPAAETVRYSNPAANALNKPGKPVEPGDFQKFIQTSIGKLLPVYGQDFFNQFGEQPGTTTAALTGNPQFAPVQNSPVPTDYLLGPGDELLIRGWGSIEFDIKTVINRSGLISLPRIGSISMAGVKFSQAESVLKAAFGKYYNGFELNLTMGQLRSITVYVVGQARRPGSYNLSSVSTLVSGVFASAGPAHNGSMRRVQLMRDGALITEFDLYDFLLNARQTGNLKLQDGDVIFYPPLYGQVAISGKVNNPAVYELKNQQETLENLLAVAGGLPVVADPGRISIEHVDAQSSQPLKIENFSLDANSLKKTVRPGDLIIVHGINPEFSNAITLRGNVSRPRRLAWQPGMRIKDVIPNKESLVSIESFKRQNEILLSKDELKVSRRVGQVADSHADENPVTNKSERESTVSLAERIGDLMEEVNFDYAVVERIDHDQLNVSLIPFNLGHVLDNAADPDNIELRPGDVITVFSSSDVRVPIAKRRIFVRVEGEVQRPGVYQMSQGDDLRTLIRQAGGLTKDAYLFGAGFYREEVKKSQVEGLQKLLRRLEAEYNGSVSQLTQSQNGGSDLNSAALQAKAQALQNAQKQALDRLRTLNPEGRIALGIQPGTSDLAEVDQIPPLRLQRGDRFHVPSRPDFVYVFGSVNTESALIYKPGKQVSDYLDLAGLSSGADRQNVILIRPDGTAKTYSGGWGNDVLSTRVEAGDTLVLPEKIDRETGWSAFTRNAKDISQIFFQMGIGAAAIKTLRQ